MLGGVAAALAVNAATDEVYRATALLRAVPSAAQPGRSAATYAELAESRGFLAEHTDFPPERVDASQRGETDLVEIVARGDTSDEARTLADEVAAALVAHADRAARQRAARVEAELRPRVDQLSAAIAELESTTGSLRSAATTDRLRALRAERAAVLARLADAAVRGALDASALVLAAPAAADPEPIRPRPERNLFGGILLGLVAGLGTSLLAGRRRGRDEQEPHVDAPTREVHLVRPSAGEEIAGTVTLEARGAGAASLELLVSDGSAEWRSLATSEGELARIEWDAGELGPGTHWLCAVARNEAGEPLASEPVPVTVAPDGAATRRRAASE